MATNNKIAWEEGLFILPHHFQQESRYLENHCNERFSNTNEYLYGLTDIDFDLKALSAGKLIILKARGVMPDGVTFDIPIDTPAPAPLVLNDAKVVGQCVHLALPRWSSGITEIQDDGGRYKTDIHDSKDQHTQGGEYAKLKTAQLQFRLMLENDDISGYNTLMITKILDKSMDNSVSIDPNYYPTSLAYSAMPALRRFIDEAANLMYERAKNLAERIGSPGQAGVAEVTDFMLLQTLNRLQPRFTHLAKQRLIHPERLYDILIQACGELSTFHAESRLAEKYPDYHHEQPGKAFTKLEEILRNSLGTLMQPRAVPINIEKREYGTYVAMLSDLSLLQTSDFIIAVKARMQLEQLRQQYQQQTKVASLEKLTELVNLQLPGIPLNALPVAPRHLPYHAGYTYFQLDNASDEWASMMQNTTGFGFHIAGNFPDLEIEFWALKRN